MSIDAVKSQASNASPTQFAPPPPVELVTLRRATTLDAATLAVIGTATFLEAFTWALPGADIVDFCLKHHTTAAYARYLSRPDTRITLAVTGQDAPVGYVMLCHPDIDGFTTGPTDIELKRIYLFSRYRANGTAQALLDAALTDAAELRAQRILLGTHVGNTRAIAFYRRNGFVEVGSRTFTVGSQQCCDLVFGKNL